MLEENKIDQQKQEMNNLSGKIFKAEVKEDKENGKEASSHTHSTQLPIVMCRASQHYNSWKGEN
ncbi:hypothetical protein E2C01_067812 [Portunus trituberculatus]|uniref:Uncharacterized protein n=1 Tax=Portunus trituberculatus TaxID=210409 RepID=A0A5B7HKT8_PORTR|nr:hypothetical protein [Portunus trituberculatus]